MVVVNMDKRPYRVIAVDDEIWALRGLCNIVDWGSYGYEVIGSFTDPHEALDNIISEKPDVVFTDIRMPDIDGMGLIDAIGNAGVRAHLVIVSAYRDFDVAKRAISKNVTDYLMKPLDKKEVAELLQRMHAALDRERSDRTFDIMHYDLSDRGNLKDPEVIRFLEQQNRDRCRLIVSDKELSSDLQKVYVKGYRYAYLSTGSSSAAGIMAACADGSYGSVGISRAYPSFADIGQMLTDAVTTYEYGFIYADNPKIASVQEYLCEHYADKLSLADIASHFFVSESYLFELFRKNTDTSAVSFIKNIRLNKAAAMLKEGSRTVGEIADTVGYPDVSYFCKLFKARFGCTPEQYAADR